MNPPSTNDSPDLPQARNTILPRVTVPHAPLACPKTRVRPTRRGRSRYLCSATGVHHWALVVELGFACRLPWTIHAKTVGLIWLCFAFFFFQMHAAALFARMHACMHSPARGWLVGARSLCSAQCAVCSVRFPPV